MAVSKAVFTLVLLAVVTGLSELVHGLNDSPTITSTTLSEVVVNPGESYTITCEGDSSIIWKNPNSLGNQPNIHSTQKNGRYISSIQLTNITYMDVGYYYCLLDNNSGKNSSIYLYVNDTKNLLTYDDNIFAPIHGMQYEDIIIPCKPTHPEVKITLCRNGDEKLNIGDNENLGAIRYNQKVGFILENAQVINNGFYSCCILRGTICSEDECPRTYSLEVLRHIDSVARPAIDDTHLQHVNVGENVTIGCRLTVPVSTKYDLEWIVPNQSDRIMVENVEVGLPVRPGHHLATGTRKLKIINAQLEDIGNYTCTVTDSARNTNSETIYLNIFERNEAYINLTVNENKTIAEVNEGQDFQWIINVEAHPQPQFAWYKSGVELNNSSRMIITSKYNGKQSILEIKHVSFEDRGTYEMVAVNANFTKELKLKLIVLGKPLVFMPQSQLQFLHGSSQRVSALILGKPSPNVTWFFQPDGNQRMAISNEHYKNYIVSEEDGYKTISVLQLNTTVSGIVECTAANQYGTDTEKTQIIITAHPESVAESH